MTRLAALMFAAATAIWGFASIPDGSISDRGSAAHERVELARMSHRALLTPTRNSGTSAQGVLTLAAMRPKAASASE
jgi:hypothetical protein